MVLLASTYDQTRWLKAADLPAEKRFRIKAVTVEEIGIGKDKETKLVVWFTNDPRGLVLNRVNNRTLRGTFGDDTAGWAGKVLAIFPTMAEFRGTMKPALRVRIPPPKQTTAGNGQGAVAAAPVQIKQPEPVEAEVDDELNDEAEIVL
jgi:hypothetical protein